MPEGATDTNFADEYYDALREDTLNLVNKMPASYSDGSDGANNWTSGGEDDSTGIVDLPPLPAPNARSPNQKDDGSGSQLAYMVDLDKLLKGPIEEIYRNNAPGDAEFLVAHMKASLQGLRPTIDSFEEYNLKLEEENRRLAEEEADLDERLQSLGIVVAPGNASKGGGGGGGASSGPEMLELAEGEDMDPELIALEKEMEFASMELDEILEMVRRDVSIVRKIESRASKDIQDFLSSEAFWEDVKDRYKRLDINNSGDIDADELFPIIVELTDSEPWAVNEAHCKKFLHIFDSDGNGRISIGEFYDLLRFCVLMTTVEGNTEQEEAEGVATVSLAKQQVDDVIKCVQDDVSSLEKFEQQCPQGVRDFLASEEFWQEVSTRYLELDVDRNGVVDPEELFPVVIELTNSEPWAVTDSHCRKFATIFDDDGDGLINLDEFEKLVRFCVIMSALDEAELDLDLNMGSE